MSIIKPIIFQRLIVNVIMGSYEYLSYPVPDVFKSIGTVPRKYMYSCEDLLL